MCIFIVNSCEKAVYEGSDAQKANFRFEKKIKETRKSIAEISFIQKGCQNTKSNPTTLASEELVVYMQFPCGVTPETETLFQNTNTIQELASLIDNDGAILQYAPNPTNSEYQITLPLETITNSLNPLVQESKQYLYSKGFSEQDIQKMLADEKAPETDLIALVMVVTQSENGLLVAQNQLNLFSINTANANVDWSEVGRCGLHALGVDILFSVGMSGATVWSTAAIKTAFKSVAKRMLGPVGVAIAVVDFGFCMGGVEI
ncbi:MAG TPA: hypothetical protein PLH91_12385 [Tenuifilaceae bacterium]|nr:hypothetical protein [Tenuifilaceae bacterium]HPI46025.1 hypothetical protein [Tenuifilaceae bacterium]